MDGELVQELSAYEWGFDMVLDGEAQPYGIETFKFDFNLPNVAPFS